MSEGLNTEANMNIGACFQSRLGDHNNHNIILLTTQDFSEILSKIVLDWEPASLTNLNKTYFRFNWHADRLGSHTRSQDTLSKDMQSSLASSHPIRIPLMCFIYFTLIMTL